MSAGDRLIVALDVPVDDAFALTRLLHDQVSNFKLGVGTFLAPRGIDLVNYLVKGGAGVMADLKLYDTRDTIKQTMDRLAALGVHFVTVHASCAKHAIGFGPKILAVDRLTDSTGGVKPFTQSAKADGVVCPPQTVRWHREALERNQIIVCPGIRQSGADPDNHQSPETPSQAIKAGANYIVVGRPIYAAPAPVEAARSIIREIEEAGCVP